VLYLYKIFCETTRINSTRNARRTGGSWYRPVVGGQEIGG
jgi:hypothetical protein